MTTSLLNALASYNAAANAGERSLRLGRLMAIAQQRRAHLSTLPAGKDILQVALPPDIRAKFPPTLAPLLERDTKEEGKLYVTHVHGTQGSDGNRYEYVLDTGRERLTVRFARKTTSLTSGYKVRLRGVRIDKTLAVANDNRIVPGTNASATAAVTVLAAAVPKTLGEQKTLVILANYIDKPDTPLTVDEVRKTIFTTVSNYFYDISYQQTWLTGDVTGWLTIPSSYQDVCDHWKIADQAKTAAAAAGFAVSNYNRLVFITPPDNCPGGAGTVGGDVSFAWVHTFNTVLQVVGHEMAHNFGLWHAHSLDCGTAIIADTGCTVDEYGDTLDLLGGLYPYHFNAFEKERLGWLNAGIAPPLVTVAQGSTAAINIAPMAQLRDSMPRAIKIPRASACGTSNDWFYVESRQAIGIDSPLLGNANVINGVVIHKVTEGDGNSGYLLDMTPETASMKDPALGAGLTFTDPKTSLTIKPLSVGMSGASVSVSYPPAACVPAVPVLTLTPTETVWLMPGKSGTYTVNLKNVNEGCACPAASYTISAAPPAGWSATSAQLAGVAPGSASSGTITITPPTDAPAGFTTIPIHAVNAALPGLAASSDVTIAVLTNHSTPSVTLSPAGTVEAIRGAVIDYRIAIVNKDNAIWPASVFNITPGLPAGWSSTAVAPVSIAAGQTGNASLRVTVPTNAVTGYHTIRIAVANAADATVVTTASGTVAVSSPPNMPPVAAASATPTTGIAPLQTTFSSSASYDPDGGKLTYNWDFGDGTPHSNEAGPSHAYAAGTYMATLTVTDAFAASATARVGITVEPAAKAVVDSYVSDITLSVTDDRTSQKSPMATASVLVVGVNNAAIAGATVKGSWSGTVKGTVSGVTDAYGRAYLNSPVINRYSQSSRLTFTVTNVVPPAGFAYNQALNRETSDVILVGR